MLLFFAVLAVPLTLWGIRRAKAWFDPVLLEQALSHRLNRLLGLDARISGMRLYSILGPEFEASLELRDPMSARTILAVKGVRLALRPLEGLHKRSARVEIIVPDAQIDLAQTAGQPPFWTTVLPKAQGRETLTPSQDETAGVPRDAWRIEIGRIRIPTASISLSAQTNPSDNILRAPLHVRDGAVDFSSSPESYLFSAHLPDLNTQAAGTWTPAAERLEWTLDSSQGRMTLRGTVDAPQSRPRVQLHLFLRDWAGGIPPVAPGGEPTGLSGVLGGELKASWESFHPDYSKATLEGAGRLEAAGGSLARMNLPAGILASLERLAAFRFLLENKRLKKEFYDFLHTRQTPFQSLHGRFEMNHGRFSFANFQARHPFYNLQVSGSFGLLDHAADLTGNLVFTDAISAALIREFPDFEALTNRKGRIELPFFCRGRWPQASPEADLNQVAARLLKARGEELRERGMTDLSELMEFHL